MEQWLYRIQDRFAAIGCFYVAVFRYAIAVLLVGAYVSLRSEWHWPDQRSLLIGFLGHLIGGLGESHHMAKTAFRAAQSDH
jgi:hypothetical protein